MPSWVRILSIVFIFILFVGPAIALGLVLSPFFFLLLLGLIFIPVLLLRPAVERSRR